MNHRSELFAVLAVMIFMCHRDDRFVRLHVDSRYVKFVLEKYCFGSLGRFLSPKNADVLRLIAEMRRYDPDRQVAVFHAPLSAHIAPVPPVKLFACNSCPPFTTPGDEEVTPVSLSTWLPDDGRDCCCLARASVSTPTSAASGSSSAVSSRTAT